MEKDREPVVHDVPVDYKLKYKEMKRRLKATEREHDDLILHLAKIKASIRRIKIEKRFMWQKSEEMGGGAGGFQQRGMEEDEDGDGSGSE